MAERPTQVDQPPTVGRLFFFGSIAVLVAVAVIGVWLVFGFVKDERARDLPNLHKRIEISV